MDARKIARVVGFSLLLCVAVAAAGERGFFGYGLAVKGGGVLSESDSQGNFDPQRGAGLARRARRHRRRRQHRQT